MSAVLHEAPDDWVKDQTLAQADAYGQGMADQARQLREVSARLRQATERALAAAVGEVLAAELSGDKERVNRAWKRHGDLAAVLGQLS